MAPSVYLERCREAKRHPWRQRGSEPILPPAPLRFMLTHAPDRKNAHEHHATKKACPGTCRPQPPVAGELGDGWRPPQGLFAAHAPDEQAPARHARCRPPGGRSLALVRAGRRQARGQTTGPCRAVAGACTGGHRKALAAAGFSSGNAYRGAGFVNRACRTGCATTWRVIAHDASGIQGEPVPD
jgi:hypothetical protein